MAPDTSSPGTALIKPQNILCSLSDMDGAEQFFPALITILPDASLYATEGTAARLNAILDGATRDRKRVFSLNDYVSAHRGTLDIVKTLDTRIFSGILADRDNADHTAAIAEQQLVLFDIVIVNFYARKIDIGGPAMLRAAAKNARYVVAIDAPQQYSPLIAELYANGGATDYPFRRNCALRTMHVVATYVRKSTSHIPRAVYE